MKKKNTTAWLMLTGADNQPIFEQVKVQDSNLVRRNGTVLTPSLFQSMGRHGYWLATHCEIPADQQAYEEGGTAVATDAGVIPYDLIELPQPEWLAKWERFDADRRGLALHSLLRPGSGASQTIRTIGVALCVLLLLVSSWGSWGTSSQVARLADTIPVMQAQLQTVTGVAPATGKVLTTVPTASNPGAPTGDK